MQSQTASEPGDSPHPRSADPPTPPTAASDESWREFAYENRNTIAAVTASFCSTVAGFPLDSVKCVLDSLLLCTRSEGSDRWKLLAGRDCRSSDIRRCWTVRGERTRRRAFEASFAEVCPGFTVIRLLGANSLMLQQ